MSLLMPTAMRFYKVCAVLGTLMIILTVSFSWMRIQQFEQTVSIVFEEIITVNLEVEGLNRELDHIDRVLNVADKNTTTTATIDIDDIQYTAYEIERLRKDKNSILLHIKEKQLDLTESSSLKKHVMNEVRIIFAAALIFLVTGTLMSVFGFVGWYFKIELFEDRRKKPR